MNRTELTLKLAKKTGFSYKVTKTIVDAIFSVKPRQGIIAVELDAGRKVTISGFGTFSTVSRKARIGRNPRTGARIQIPAKKYPVFKAGKFLKERVSG